MTAPNGQQAPQQQFTPDPHFAVRAQQEEIERLRQVEASLNDRIIYLRAVVLQIEAEAQHRDSLRLGEIEQLRAELEEARKGPQPAPDGVNTTGGGPVDPDAVAMAAAAAQHQQLAFGDLTEPTDRIERELADQVATGTHNPLTDQDLVEIGHVRIDHDPLPTPETAKFDGMPGIPEPQPGIPVDEEFKSLNVVDPVWSTDEKAEQPAEATPGPERG